jgi:hypothetical protein
MFGLNWALRESEEGDESRYVTGQHIRVDGGSLLKWPNGPGG